MLHEDKMEQLEAASPGLKACYERQENGFYRLLPFTGTGKESIFRQKKALEQTAHGQPDIFPRALQHKQAAAVFCHTLPEYFSSCIKLVLISTIDVYGTAQHFDETSQI